MTLAAEDCGGIWGFYDYLDEATPFDMDGVNRLLSTWIYPVNNHSDLEDEENLKELAQIHHFTRYSRFNKKELAKWLKNCFLETQFMKKLLQTSTEEEFRTFENAIKENGIMIPEELLSESLLLCTYGAYDPYCFIDDMIVDSNRKITTIVRHNF